MDKFTKKKIFVIVGIFIVVVCAVVVLSLIISGAWKDNDTSDKPSDEYGRLDKTGNLNVKGIVAKDKVKEAIGDQGKDLSDASLTPILMLGQQKRQAANFDFVMKNGEKAIVSIDAKIYPSKKDMEAAKPFTRTEPQRVDGVGEEAHWLKPTPEAAQPVINDNDVLMAVKGKTSYAIKLSQPYDKRAISHKDARAIILEIAKAANLDALK